MLTQIEERIARLVTRGWTNDEVAREVGLRPKTVEWHLSRVYRKVGVRGRTELAARAAAAIPSFRSESSRSAMTAPAEAANARKGKGRLS
jgi:DNA-binding CsgD family transcriptional regulator